MASEKPAIVVGVGASAGGLEALIPLFRGMTSDTGMAFVVVTHMARGKGSAMAEILSRNTDLSVANVGEDVHLTPNSVYIAGPDVVLTLQDGWIRTSKRETPGQAKPIDVFFSSLAETYREHAVGIVLSGGGSDGTLGLKAIKEQGGLTLSQGADGTAPMQSSMPDAAVAAGVVDLVIAVEDMPAWLARYAKELPRFAALANEDTEALEEDEEGSARDARHYEQIFRLLLNQIGHDFSGYKKKTFARRVRRRMQVRQVREISSYVDLLKRDPDEVTALFRDLLIGVTNFFRDPEAFDALGKNVIPALFEGKGVSETVRIWIPGCATGEEVYSIAILVREYIETLRQAPKVQIFATDIDEAALAIARVGRYPASLLDNVSAQRLQRFFSGDDISYSVNKTLRDMCIFSSHSVLRDPPFSRIDLISCRNLLIYLGTDFQAQVVPVFHFALRPRGFLFLGTSENVSQHGDLFTPIEKKHRIFQRRDHVATPLQFPMVPHHRRAASHAEPRIELGNNAMSLRRAVESRVMDRFAPAHVLINREGDILHYSPRTGKYLEPAAGLPNRHLLSMARRGLRLELRALLREALESRKLAVKRQIPVDLDDRVQLTDVIVEPLNDSEHDPLFLVLFSDVGPPQTADQQQARREEGDRNAERLETDLRDTRERLQSTIEEYETAVEELKSSNEELQSMNEELQSTNEELETSKEELQSVNEELHTVNSELNAKVDEIDRVNADLRNVFDSTQIATIFLDSKLIVRSFTPTVTAIFNLISSDRGRPLTDIAHHLQPDGDLKRDIMTVLERGVPVERPVQHVNGTHYLMRILPYRLSGNVIDGVLITFVDVSNMARAEERQRTMVEELNHRVRNMLMVAGAIAKQTLARASDPKEFTESFLGRLDAMANAYGLISRERWTGVSMQELILTELGPYQKEADKRVSLAGPDITLPPTQAVAFGMVLHELATNAAKYGALSTAKGRVDVRWNLGKDGMSFDWTESDGPAVTKPKRKGFGTELIERQLKDSLGATVDFAYGARGVHVHIVVPKEKLGAG